MLEAFSSAQLGWAVSHSWLIVCGGAAGGGGGGGGVLVGGGGGGGWGGSLPCLSCHDVHAGSW